MLFDNIGGKIKGVSRLACWAGIIGCCLIGLRSILSQHAILGLVTAGFGSLLFWISSLAIYGFGQLVENSDILVECFQKRKPENAAKLEQTPLEQKPLKPTKRKDIPPDAIVFPSYTEDEITCPRCGFVQKAYQKCCQSCKAPFVYEDELY